MKWRKKGSSAEAAVKPIQRLQLSASLGKSPTTLLGLLLVGIDTKGIPSCDTLYPAVVPARKIGVN